MRFSQVLIRMPPDLHAAIKRLALLNDRSMSAEIRMAIREHLSTSGFEVED